MSTTTLRTLTVAAGAAALTALAVSSPALAADEDQLAETYDNVRCDVMAMPGTATATYLDESVHGPYLDRDNEWVALTLTSDEGAVEVADPAYGETYGSEGGAIIREITLCQGTAAADAEAPAPEEEAAEEAAADEEAAPETEAGGSDGEDEAAQDGEAAEDDAAAEEEQAAGPAVETDGPLREAGLSPLLIGGAVLAVAGAGAAAVGLRRQPQRDQS
ncbi:hypothetical protein [Serinicoccus profundi]|uniref:hypothetical protein n=1 Tax=Serinicoccus profundi TaxID=1078471 RepID=UPI000255E326|nr:hypothetical protein [Serinicoccus profundi]